MEDGSGTAVMVKLVGEPEPGIPWKPDVRVVTFLKSIK
jgi:hypothetical protein